MPRVRPQIFKSADATKAEDGDVVISFFDGPNRAIAILKGSTEATLNLLSKIASSLVNVKNDTNDK